MSRNEYTLSHRIRRSFTFAVVTIGGGLLISGVQDPEIFTKGRTWVVMPAVCLAAFCVFLALPYNPPAGPVSFLPVLRHTITRGPGWRWQTMVGLALFIVVGTVVLAPHSVIRWVATGILVAQLLTWSVLSARDDRDKQPRE